MSTDLIRYDLLVQEALKGVVRRVLADAARDGLPGEHHFYVSFRTDHAGVRLSQRLRDKYPQDMTIVLQHQFEALTVNDQAFEVGLSFSGVPERLRVPFDALTGFFDPSVQFGLKFETSDPVEEADEAEPEGPAAQPIPLAPPKPKGKGTGPKLAARKTESAEREKPAKKEPAPESGGGSAEVVSLDSFRKKS
ncbi:SspB family protein [Enterovirga aerilata]|uniref:Stringent starvation protein B n=1 Tax=Enterovirga aerilata TaxID=2730920 RepID=A0A849I5Z2_9HYPH|nr:ClpXP protease specificity-enhancing factor SspB [Enterovirga sp. DB1703]NNM71457.1 Stringent starvation protein B [Enterovirga sp. DB1703]